MENNLNFNFNTTTADSSVSFNRENVFLAEIHDVSVKERATVDNEFESFITGRKIFRVIKPPAKSDGEFEIISQYENESDHTDLTNLKNECTEEKISKGIYIVSVYIDSYNNTLKWYHSKLLNFSNDNEIFFLNGIFTCTPEQIKELNEIFPEYYDECVKNYKLLNK